MRRIRTKAHATATLAAVGATALVLPLLATASAEALIPKANLKVVKTVASHGPTISLNPTLSDTRDNGHLEWVANGLHVYTDALGNAADKRIVEYVDTSTPLSEVSNAALSLPYVAAPNTESPQYTLLVDRFDGDGVADLLLTRPGNTDNWLGYNIDGSPANLLNNFTTNAGTFAAWTAVVTPPPQIPGAPQPVVTAFGFAFPGPSAHVDGTLSAIDFAGTTYDLARLFQPSIAAAPGETVSYRIDVNNLDATKAAAAVQLVDVLPPDMTALPATLNDGGWGCGLANNILTCSAATLPIGSSRTVQFDAVLDETISTTGLPQTEGHWVDVQDNAAANSIPVGQTRTTTVACPEDYLATDGSLLLDQAGASSDVVIASSRATTVGGNAGWAVKATNLGDSLAEVTAQVTCLAEEVGSSGGHTHAIAATSLGLQQKITAVDPGMDGRPVQRSCPIGYTPFAPQFDIAAGTAVIRESYAVDNIWYWYVDHSDGTDASFGISCLSPRTLSASGHTAELVISVPDDTIAIGSEIQTEGVMACPADSSAITGGYGGYTSRVRSLGAEPRGESYMFRFYNEEDSTQNADIQVTCVGGLTADEPTYKDVINTAYVTTTTKDRSLADNSSEAGVAVSGTPASSQPSGVTLNPLTAERTVANNKTTALKMTLTCTKGTPCDFTVKAFSGTTLVANKTTTILANSSKLVSVPTTNAGKLLTFGDTITVKIKTTAGTTSYAVGVINGP